MIIRFGDEDDVVFPPLKRKRAGRPVNSMKTNVIGLTTGVKAFEKKSKHQQQNTVLNMLLKSPLKGKRRRLGDKYDRDDIKDDIKDISSATMNDDIDVGLIFPKLTEGARQKVSSLVSKLKELGVFYCPVCGEKIDEAEDMTDGGRESVMCSSCMEWIHLHDCSGERRMPKSKFWYCSTCKNV